MARAALREIEGCRVVGLGSGATVARFVEALGEYVQETRAEVMIIPSSLQIQLAAERAGLGIAPPHLIPSIDATVDGADQIDRWGFMIKGGGGALFRERVLLQAAKKRIILADQGKFVAELHGPVPVEVSSFARAYVEESLRAMKGEPRLRTFDKGYPFVTENGNVILDTDFGMIADPPRLKSRLKGIAGVVEAGVFTLRIHVYLKAGTQGAVVRFTPLPWKVSHRRPPSGALVDADAPASKGN